MRLASDIKCCIKVPREVELTEKIPCTIQPWNFFSEPSYAFLAHFTRSGSPVSTSWRKMMINCIALWEEKVTNIIRAKIKKNWQNY